MGQISGRRIRITGVVQGVGFRPFVYGLAKGLAITGWVRNSSAGVDIEAVGSRENLQAFVQALKADLPPLARIDELWIEERPPDGYSSFDIVDSRLINDAFQPVSPDVGVCADCLRELFDPADRRYRYPFINCTNCGPRFTIIDDIPYDRPKTTMAPFQMCPDCAAEYGDPLNRRFHAQPVACPACGPNIWLESSEPPRARSAAVDSLAREVVQSTPLDAQIPAGDAALSAARRLLAAGKIVAIKGLGGFHLACDAANRECVGELRRRKLRVDKAFALMLPDLETVARHCHVGLAERALLLSRERPIVILQRRFSSPIASAVAPGQNTLGVMLPYTPLHYLLLEPEAGFPEALVMTSGNLGEEPIARDNLEAKRRLASLADAFLVHDRDIRSRCDDSVVRLIGDFGHNDAQDGHARSAQIYPLRRSRGYAPYPVLLPHEAPPIFAAGAELKNAFCLTRDRYAFLSHHIGDLENYETLTSYEESVRHFERLFRIRPRLLAHDRHPDYLASRYAQDRAQREGLPTVVVQHHHAHVAACMAEHELSGDEPVIGVSFDGAGLGLDGAIWGGEFLAATYHHFERLSHLAAVPLPGGDRAVREPFRMALAWLDKAGKGWDERLPPVKYAAQTPQFLEVLSQQLRAGLNAPPTSSMGRLFDAVASLVGLRQVVNYEGQAAMELEAAVNPDEGGRYAFDFGERIDATPVIAAVVDDWLTGAPPGVIAARFHNGLAVLIRDQCLWLRDRHGLVQVALTGGVFQNVTLLSKTWKLLNEAGFKVWVHHLVPANDGGLALGQAAVAAATWAAGTT